MAAIGRIAIFGASHLDSQIAIEQPHQEDQRKGLRREWIALEEQVRALGKRWLDLL
jgi:hypothetical protein